MHESIKGHEIAKKEKKTRLSAVIFQIVMIDLVFSFDSVISAIGMTNDISHEAHGNPLVIIFAAVIISMIIMLIFAKPISDFINARPTIKMIALAFLTTIGVVLIAEAFGEEIPKGYIYFAMVYALLVEFLNIRMRKNKGEPER
jgi:predicted tellurium resistance membrane protein TerC